MSVVRASCPVVPIAVRRSYLRRAVDRLRQVIHGEFIFRSYRAGELVVEMEKEAITAALKEVGGNRREAAEMLGIGERTLYRKINEYEIPL